ncbi:hypothetical protein GCM10027093_62020 [Paraburkholderia jirisanensis]
MVSIKPDRNNRRAKLVQLTSKGLKKLQEAIGYWQIAQDRFENVFGKRRAAALRTVLGEVGHTHF